MTFSVKFDFSDFERKAKELSAAADQIPFALAKALNEAVENAQTILILKTWPSAVRVRNAGFMRAALRRRFASKHNLTAEVYDVLHRGHLKEHAVGGTKTARGANIAIPMDDIPRTARGVSKSNRPAALIANTPRRALRVTRRGIFIGQGGRLKLKYALKRTVPIPADVPFESDFATAVRDGIRVAFPVWIKRAMKTRAR
jgi:hypothetical protein